MKTISIRIKGQTPLILHSCQCVNPLHPISVKLKALTGKRKKTEDDLRLISDLEWEGGLYWDDDMNAPYIPAENLEATIKEAAKHWKRGKDVAMAFSVLDMKPVLDYGEQKTKKQLAQDFRYRDVRAMSVQRAKVVRTRPRFNVWSCEFTAAYDETILDIGFLADCFTYAGNYVGLCDSRPKYGKFCAAIEELD